MLVCLVTMGVISINIYLYMNAESVGKVQDFGIKLEQRSQNAFSQKDNHRCHQLMPDHELAFD